MHASADGKFVKYKEMSFCSCHLVHFHTLMRQAHSRIHPGRVQPCTIVFFDFEPTRPASGSRLKCRMEAELFFTGRAFGQGFGCDARSSETRPSVTALRSRRGGFLLSLWLLWGLNAKRNRPLSSLPECSLTAPMVFLSTTGPECGIKEEPRSAQTSSVL